MAANTGILLPGNLSNEVVYPIDTFARTISFNDAPLISRLPRQPIGADKFKMGAKKVRARAKVLGAALADNTNTTITLTDVSDLMIGDVIELLSGERVEVTADPTITNTTTGAGTITVRRGIASTTAAAQNNSTAATLVGNSRTGGEVDQTAFRTIQTYTDQYVQTFQFPVQVGGKTNAMNAISLPPGQAPLFESERILKALEMERDVDYAILHGKGEYGATGNRSKMVGLRNLIDSNNVTTDPTNKAAYKPGDLIRDTIEKVASAGGFPNVLLCSVDFASAFAIWGHPTQAFSAGTDVYGLPIRRMMVPFLGFDLELIVHPQLAAKTCVCLSTTDRSGSPAVRVRHIRQESWLPRAGRGDAVEGDYLCDFSIEVDNLTHHAWVQGITTFSI